METVSSEVSVHTDLSEIDISNGLGILLSRLRDESEDSLSLDPESSITRDLILQYRSLAEVIVVFGATLTALRDKEE